MDRSATNCSEQAAHRSPRWHGLKLRLGSILTSIAVLFATGLAYAEASSKGVAEEGTTAASVPISGTGILSPRSEGPTNATVVVTFGGSGIAHIGIRLYAIDEKGKSDELLAQCETPCALLLRKGLYRVALGDEWGGGSSTVGLFRSRAVVVSERNPAAAYWGLGMGIAGPLVFVGGGFAVILASFHQEKCGDSCTRSTGASTEEAVGIGMIVGGAALTVVGCAQFSF
jgi:hypothetical protein